MTYLELPQQIVNNMDAVWTFMLLLTRFTGFFYVVPGLGEGPRGIALRGPAIMVLSFASMRQDSFAAVPPDAAMLFAQIAMELLLGMAIGIVPLMIVGGAQMAAQLASSSMGFGAGQMMDPTTGGTVSDLSRLIGDLTVIMFLMIGGDHIAIQAVSGLGGEIQAGGYMPTQISVELLINRSADIFRVGILMSAPVIVALLLTQFVMGLISKAVPTVNIFIVSFPLTIGIGLFLMIIALPDMMNFVYREMTGVENTIVVLASDAKR